MDEILIFFLLIGLITLALIVYALVDLIKNKSLTDVERVLWIILILLFPVVGALVYLIVKKWS